MMQLKVLIVEDQFLEADSLRHILTAAGYTVQGVGRSVDQALAALNVETPDIVLLDIFLKGELNGIYLASILHRRNIPFIYLSANSNATTLSQAMATRPDGFLVKPFREQELLMAMDIAVYRHQKNQEQITRQKNWLKGLLDNLAVMQGARSEKMKALVHALTTFLPLDYIVVDTQLDDKDDSTLYHYQRIAFDDFRRIDCRNEPYQSVFPNVASYRKKNRDKLTPFFLNGMDLVSDYKSDTVYDNIRRARKLQAKFWLPLLGPRGIDMSISFYSCSDELYSPDHYSLMTSLSDLLARVIHSIRKTRPTDADQALGPSAHTGSDRLKPRFEGIVGSSPKLLDAFDKVTQVAPFDNTILVLGETGVGKEGLVTAIHHLSNRRNKPLIKINCAAIPANLVESELFGHEKGAFTGAFEKRIGKFEQAAGGTIFLDEIGELPLEVQSKLLRAIQEKEIERVGGRTTIQTDVRIITATNRDLLKEIAAGKFRLDLYYRINVFPITLPPLRERIEDIAPLAQHFLQRLALRFSSELIQLSPKALEQLKKHTWPGNIREMEHLIERHVLQARSNMIDSFDMPASLLANMFAATPEPEIKSFEEMDREHIVKALEKCNGKVSGRGGAAELLKLKPTTLYSKMKRLRINSR